jgi:hypothetical protein
MILNKLLIKKERSLNCKKNKLKRINSDRINFNLHQINILASNNLALTKKML